MSIRKYVPELVLGVVAVAFLPFRWQVSTGIVLGYAFSVLYLRLLVLRVDSILAHGRVGLLAYLGQFLGLALLGCPLLLAVSHPGQFSWVGVLVGLLARKAALYIDAFRGGSHDL